MCTRQKGRKPEPTEAVTDAVKKMRWKPDDFFRCAAKFAPNAKGFDPKAAAIEFEELQTKGATDFRHMISSAAVAFAYWVLVADVADVAHKFSGLNIRRA